MYNLKSLHRMLCFREPTILIINNRGPIKIRQSRKILWSANLKSAYGSF